MDDLLIIETGGGTSLPLIETVKTYRKTLKITIEVENKDREIFKEKVILRGEVNSFESGVVGSIYHIALDNPPLEGGL